MDFHRRYFLKIGVQATAASLIPVTVLASIGRLLLPERSLSFYNTHTDESLDVCYFSHGQYQITALKKIDYILRDHRAGKINPIDKRLIDLLHSISTTFHHPVQFHIISGYRTPDTNAMLCKKSSGVAGSSLHMKGQAVDIRIPDYNTMRLRDICWKLRSGGVGYYPKSDFVHVDIGRIRRW
ncbi:MAG: DUF882 domain-containing protein [Desulfobacterales bacterium]|nr:MAG: DUF882 domain-containing protein [Desulfobacterales bacterium]UCD89954.1 MAG: DUF882 domain-containing protein [Desulfobacterales bacterium]